MRQLAVATTQQSLLQELTALADLYSAQVVCPDDFDELACSDAVALVIDPLCLSEECWNTYVHYLMELEGEDSTPLVVLLHSGDYTPFILPERIACKPEGTLLHCYDDDMAAVSAIVEEALLGTRNQWNISTQQCAAPSILDVEECYIAANLPDGYVVVVARPADDAASMVTFEHLATLVGFDTVDWAGAAFLTFNFTSEEDARRFAARIPAGMATLYAQGKYVEVCDVCDS